MKKCDGHEILGYKIIIYICHICPSDSFFLLIAIIFCQCSLTVWINWPQFSLKQGTYIKAPPVYRPPLAFKKFNQTLNYVPNIESILIWKLCFENDCTINLVKGLSIVFFQTILEKISVYFSKYTLKFENIWWKCEHFLIKATIYLKTPPPPPPPTLLVQVKWICNTCHLNANTV